MSSYRRLICWYFGHDPYMERPSRYPATPCARCGICDVDYADLACLTRHAAVKRWLIWWLLRRWFPDKCPDCGRRYGDHEDCRPF